MQNGNGHGNGFGKRWLLIGLLILGGFWIVNDAYDDGFRDAMLASGQGATIRRYHGGPDFPWGLIVLGGIGYIAWRKGAFDRFGGPGGPFDGGGRGIQRYGNGGYVGGQGAGLRGPRAFFDDWHRQAHEAHQATYGAPPAAPPAPSAGQQYTQAQASNGAPGGGVHHAPPPPPPAPDYWASMARDAGTQGTQFSPPPAPPAPPASPAPEARTDGNADTPAPERW